VGPPRAIARRAAVNVAAGQPREAGREAAGRTEARRGFFKSPSIQSVSHNQIAPRYKAAKRRRLQAMLAGPLLMPD
jgi:hypothetical protein